MSFDYSIFSKVNQVKSIWGLEPKCVLSKDPDGVLLVLSGFYLIGARKCLGDETYNVFDCDATIVANRAVPFDKFVTHCKGRHEESFIKEYKDTKANVHWVGCALHKKVGLIQCLADFCEKAGRKFYLCMSFDLSEMISLTVRTITTRGYSQLRSLTDPTYARDLANELIKVSILCYESLLAYACRNTKNITGYLHNYDIFVLDNNNNAVEKNTFVIAGELRYLMYDKVCITLPAPLSSFKYRGNQIDIGGMWLDPNVYVPDLRCDTGSFYIPLYDLRNCWKDQTNMGVRISRVALFEITIDTIQLKRVSGGLRIEIPTVRVTAPEHFIAKLEKYRIKSDKVITKSVPLELIAPYIRDCCKKVNFALNLESLQTTITGYLADFIRLSDAYKVINNAVTCYIKNMAEKMKIASDVVSSDNSGSAVPLIKRGDNGNLSYLFLPFDTLSEAMQIPRNKRLYVCSCVHKTDSGDDWYTLVDKNSHTGILSKAEVKTGIRSGDIHIVNMRLAKNGALCLASNIPVHMHQYL